MWTLALKIKLFSCNTISATGKLLLIQTEIINTVESYFVYASTGECCMFSFDFEAHERSRIKETWALSI